MRTLHTAVLSVSLLLHQLLGSLMCSHCAHYCHQCDHVRTMLPLLTVLTAACNLRAQ